MVGGQLPAVHDGVIRGAGNQRVDQQGRAFPFDRGAAALRAHLIAGLGTVEREGVVIGAANDVGLLHDGQHRLDFHGERLDAAAIGIQLPFTGKIAIGIGGKPGDWKGKGDREQGPRPSWCAP